MTGKEIKEWLDWYRNASEKEIRGVCALVEFAIENGEHCKQVESTWRAILGDQAD